MSGNENVETRNMFFGDRTDSLNIFGDAKHDNVESEMMAKRNQLR